MPSMMGNGAQRRVGIAGVEKAQSGEHFCVVFHSKAELLELVVPFIKTGLEDHEFCIWITGDPITEKEAFEALDVALPDAHRFLAAKQLEIVPSTQWYLRGGTFDMDTVLESWMYRARRADADGFAGIRITGTPAWLQTEEDWSQFGRYEETVHRRIRSENILALCTYPTWICQGKKVLNTLKCHSSALLSDNGEWRRLELSSQ